MKLLIILVSIISTIYGFPSITNSTTNHTIHTNHTFHHFNITSRPRTFLKFMPHFIPRHTIPVHPLQIHNLPTHPMPHAVYVPSITVSPLNKFRIGRATPQHNIALTKPGDEFKTHLDHLKEMARNKTATQEALHLIHDEEQKLIKDYYAKKNELAQIKNLFIASPTSPKLGYIRHRTNTTHITHPIHELSKLNHTFQMNNSAHNNTGF
jgi:hypothetical protein